MRVWRFIKTLWWLRQDGLLTKHNVRAAWIQSDPYWLAKQAFLDDLSDEEIDLFLEAIDK